ncbi:MAG: M20/M25/M40 family metallo-hydrolase [Balneolaceae bacterium]
MPIIRTAFSLLIPIFLFTPFACEPQPDVESVDQPEQLLQDVEYLSSNELEGRRTGTEGNLMAQLYIEERFESLGLMTFGDTYRHPFDFTNPRSEQEFTGAVNIIGYVEGSENPNRFIVITAHYDHLGEEDGEIYNGADDNASGTAGLMSLARYFSENQPKNSILFVAFDAEEQGLSGARHFVDNSIVSLEQIALNINMDMISTNFENELYAVGTYHYPFLKPMIEESAADAEINVLFGYDSDEWDQDWTLASDHGPFHQKGVPFVYFGVEDHEHYHAPSDTFENINPDFYLQAVETITEVAKNLDERLDEIVEASGREIEVNSR